MDFENLAGSGSSVSGEVIKHGESCVRWLLNRTTHGLKIQCKAHPCVEDFMRSIGGGEKVDPQVVGRHWVQLAGQPLMAYVIPTLASPQNGPPSTLEALGQPLLLNASTDNDGRTLRMPGEKAPKADTINISFLRMVGVSEGIGIAVGVKGVYSTSQLIKLRDQLVTATRAFYIEYLQELDLGGNIERGTGSVTTQDTRY